MSEKEQNIVQSFAAALPRLNDAQQEQIAAFITGFTLFLEQGKTSA